MTDATPSLDWRPDVLGAGFEAATIALPPDAEGPVEATLVRHRDPAAPEPGAGAVLYVHGFNDYFFQTGLARWFTARGWAFHALDLRKHGRSLRAHQTPFMCRTLEDYDAELDAAAAAILGAGHRRLLLVAHSTGGLTVPLWAARRPDLPVAGLVANSPFLQLKQPSPARLALLPAVTALARVDPHRTLPAGVSGLYGESLHASRKGEWDYSLEWKPLSAPVRAGWLVAVAAGQRRVAGGLDLGFPVLALSSTRTVTAREWGPELHRGDAVLDAGSIARRAPRLGRHVTVIRVADAMHDVWLSQEPSRAEAYEVTGRWLDAWVG